jgi:hypothetical protein
MKFAQGMSAHASGVTSGVQEASSCYTSSCAHGCSVEHVAFLQPQASPKFTVLCHADLCSLPC